MHERQQLSERQFEENHPLCKPSKKYHPNYHKNLGYFQIEVPNMNPDALYLSFFSLK